MSGYEPCVVGVDVGTSGVRAVAIDKHKQLIADANLRFAEGLPATDKDTAQRCPARWSNGVQTVLKTLFHSQQTRSVVAISIDGTSGTLLAVDSSGAPLAAPMMYNDTVEDSALLNQISQAMPATSGAGGVTSGLAKAAVMLKYRPDAIVHQADWIVGLLTGNYRLSDANNALKTGFDPVSMQWPDWIDEVAPVKPLLPEVFLPGESVAVINPAYSQRFQISDKVQVIAGTTDGCASFLATGASEVGDAVTALGSTMTLKLLSNQPVFAPEYGVYSHRIGEQWLAGGASNTGGRVLEALFSDAELNTLSEQIDPSAATGLNYYPLPQKGERFPFNDPDMEPILSPRPEDNKVFLQGVLEGMARIEKLGYEKLVEHGGPSVLSVCSVGGGAANASFEKIRQRHLSVQFRQPLSEQAAYGAALLAARAADCQSLW